MKIKNLFKLFYLSVFLLLQSISLLGQLPGITGEQSQVIYLPDNGDFLAVAKKSEIKFSFETHITRGFDTNIKLGYSPLNHLYITTGLFRSQYSQNIYYHRKNTMKDIGLGTYCFFKTKIKANNNKSVERKKKHWMMQNGILVNGLLAYSRGKSTLVGFDKFGYGQFYFDRKYLQLGSQFQSNIWGVAGVVKFGRLIYHDVILRGQASIDQVRITDTLMHRNRYSFMETGLRFFIGTKFGQFNLGVVTTAVGPDFNKEFYSNYWSMGIVLNIQNIFRNLVHRSKR